MARLSIKAVLIGGTVDVVGSIVLGLPFALYAMSKLDLSHASADQMGAQVAAAMYANKALYFGQLLTGMACSVLGGFVAAWLAGHDELPNGALSSVLSVSLGIFTLSSGKDPNPLWVQIVLLFMSPVLGFIGGALMRRERNAARMRVTG